MASLSVHNNVAPPHSLLQYKWYTLVQCAQE